nr:MAG TPA: hypothetical protein [Caudoviricetes sp.]
MVFKGKPRYDLTLRQSRAGHCVPIPDKGRVAFIGGGLPACRNVKVRPRIFTAKGFCRILPNHITEFLIAGFSDWRQPHGHRDRRSAESPYKTQGHGGAKAINDVAGVARQALVRHYAFSRARWCLTRAVITPPSCSPSSHGMRTPYIFSAIDSTYAHDFLVSRRRALILPSRFSNSGRTFGPFGRLSFHPRLRKAATSITNWRSVQSAEERLPVRFCSMARYVSSSRPRSLRAICNFAMRERLVFILTPHKVVNGVKLNAAVQHDGDIPKAVGGADGRAGDVARPDRRRAGNAARHFDAGLHRQVRHGYRGNLAARRELGGKGGDFIGAKEQLLILQIVPAPIEPNPEAPGGAAVVFRRGKLDLHADGAKTYTNRATEFFIRACHFPHRSRAAFGVGAVGATALRASQHTLSMFSAASGASLSIKKVATIRFFAVS